MTLESESSTPEPKVQIGIKFGTEMQLVLNRLQSEFMPLDDENAQLPVMEGISEAVKIAVRKADADTKLLLEELREGGLETAVKKFKELSRQIESKLVYLDRSDHVQRLDLGTLNVRIENVSAALTLTTVILDEREIELDIVQFLRMIDAFKDLDYLKKPLLKDALLLEKVGNYFGAEQGRSVSYPLQMAIIALEIMKPVILSALGRHRNNSHRSRKPFKKKPEWECGRRNITTIPSPPKPDTEMLLCAFISEKNEMLRMQREVRSNVEKLRSLSASDYTISIDNELREELLAPCPEIEIPDDGPPETPKKIITDLRGLR